ncbi:YhgE/Pip domain-containing protein [Enterococcus massiliensis]|uniref:YhgE/Pip domain-containing protein n=1 Tax=Enterococcus massiliensis TaxID=1640685 RepID=UPI00065DCFD0|nr:YhgE/Pip domain-containing protein [Enterococcus massiliensis]
MNHIKNTLHLYKLDWKRIFKNPMATFLIIALAILPSLYAWFNIKALWDPYSNTGELPIAVYSADQSTTFQGKEIAIGKEVLDELHDNKQLGWQFVDSKKALTEGVKSGKYYAGIYLPKDFSENLLSFVSGEINKPKIEYYINEKINAIAPKITDKGASSLQDQISENFIKTASSTLLKVFNEIGYDIDSNLVSINKVKNLILETDENIDTIDGYTKQVVELQEKMPEIKEKIAKAEEFVDYVPKVDEMGDKLLALNEKMPELKKQASIILTLQEKIPEIQNAGKQLAAVDADFDDIEQTMTEGISEAKSGLEIIQQVQTILPDIKKLGNQADQLAATTEEGATKLQEAIPSITSSVSVTLNAISQVATTTSSIVSSINQALTDNQLTDVEKQHISQVIQDFKDNIARQQTAITDLVTFLTQLQEAAGNQSLQGIIEKLNHANDLLGDLSGRLTTLDGLIKNGNSTAIQNYLREIESAATAVATFVDSIDVDTVGKTVSDILTKLVAALSTAQDALEKAQKIDFDSLLNATEKTVANAIGLLEKYQKDMPAIRQEVHDANTMLNGHMTEIVEGINKGADLYKNELPVLEQKLGLAADFLENDWPTVKKEITSTMNMVDEKLPEVESALNAAVELINNDWPTLKTGLHKAATTIRAGEEEVDLGEIIKLLKLDAQKESDFFTKPVELQTNQIYPIANNGSASTPFYTALCLWVGALLLSSVATTEFHLEGSDKKKYTKRETFTARMLTFLTMALFQALIVTLGNYFLLGVDVHNPFYAVLFALIVGLAFMMIVYVLSALFGNIGKGIAIILLVLSISGGGGNYPIQVSGKFFQFINPLLPFTHAVNLLREPAGGIYWPNATANILIMVALFVVFGLLGTFVYPYLSEMTRKLAKVSKESHFFH